MECAPALRDILEKDDFLCKIDLKDAYVVVPIHPESQKYLAFENGGILYQYTSLAFGLSVAPRIFSKLMRYAIESLREKGIRLIYYLDDICIMEKSKEKMKQTVNLIRQHLEGLGFLINKEKREDRQTTATFTTSREVNSPFVPVDSQFTWKDDSSNSSNWRSLITHTSPTTRSREEPTAEQSQLGQDMPNIPMGETRDSVVEDVSDQEKRTTDTTGTVAGTISYNLCGRIRCEMRSLLKNNRNIRVLELRRQRKVYERARTQGDLLCSSNARKNIKQHGRGNSIFRPSRFGGKDSRPMQPAPVTGSLSTYSGSREYQGRSIESIAETNLRDDSTSEDVSATLPDVGKNDESRRVRSQSQLSIAEILELSDGSFCGKDRRVSTELETERPLHVPPVEINSKSFTENESRQNEGSSSGHPTVEKPILVSHDSTFQSSLTTNRMEDTARELEFNRLAIINNKRKSDGMNEGLIDHLNKAIRLSTNKVYDGYWKKYVIWCQKKEYDAEKYDIQQILQYLSDHNHLQYSQWISVSYSQCVTNSLSTATTSGRKYLYCTILSGQETPRSQIACFTKY
ncbi:hypothetical protein G6F64_010529 [Rhizopus arrhizus]|uniref:Reverse transcriptase domain-containing protein n=1 Tax=Rhizopus oryzae TaxID=64495 RepID=A0A9P7BNB1_RHIOR|nr:hypothetical protein G6F64_010529 [Rhizopus arrhizus]